MINFVVTNDHRYPLLKLLRGEVGHIPFVWQQWSYEDLLKAKKVSTGTWIFQDIERLTERECIGSARIATALRTYGATVLNHPARAAARYELQRRLFAAKLNGFQVYRADEYRIPQRWPVFIRFENNHNNPDPKLINTVDELKKAFALYRKKSIPLSALMVVEYCGEPFEDGLWRKFSAYRIGSKIVHHHIVKQDSWVAKYGNPALDFDEAGWIRIRSEEKNFVDQIDDPFRLMRVFQHGQIEFGRVDFSFVKGVVQIYEINTNPSIDPLLPVHDKFPIFPRSAIFEGANARIIEALMSIDKEPNTMIDIGNITSASKRL